MIHLSDINKNGLDKIIDEIMSDAKAEADRITDEARLQAKRIIDRAKEEAAAVEAEAEEKAELEYKRVLTRARSTGDITKKSALLREKQQIIHDILNEAHIKLVGLNDKDYFAFMQKLLDKYASGKGGEIILSAKDKARITDEFKASAEKKGLKISDKTRAIDGGFILSYGDVEENCSIEALMESERDCLHDAVNGFLFG